NEEQPWPNVRTESVISPSAHTRVRGVSARRLGGAALHGPELGRDLAVCFVREAHRDVRPGELPRPLGEPALGMLACEEPALRDRQPPGGAAHRGSVVDSRAIEEIAHRREAYGHRRTPVTVNR